MVDKHLTTLEATRRRLKRVRKRARLRGADGVVRRYTRLLRFNALKIARRKRWAKAKKAGAFQPWMLNGRPTNVELQVQKVIAIAVTRFGLVVTSTSTGPHTGTSYHFPWNNPRHNGKGRAVDLAGSWKNMVRFYNWTVQHKAQFDESFGPPNNHFIKHGTQYAGAIPNHYNHNHVAPKYGARF